MIEAKLFSRKWWRSSEKTDKVEMNEIARSSMWVKDGERFESFLFKGFSQGFNEQIGGDHFHGYYNYVTKVYGMVIEYNGCDYRVPASKVCDYICRIYGWGSGEIKLEPNAPVFYILDTNCGMKINQYGLLSGSIQVFVGYIRII